MSTPYICRQCVARLAGRSTRPLRYDRGRWFTQTAVGSESLTNVSETQQSAAVQTPPMLDPVLETHSDRLPSDMHTSVSPYHALDSLEDHGARWEGLKKFIPRPKRRLYRHLQKAPPPAGPQDLKAKILKAQGDFTPIRRDIRDFYGLSYHELPGTVGQLERLLWGRGSYEAGTRLDDFHVWKSSFLTLLRAVNKSGTDGHGSGTSNTTQSASGLGPDATTMKVAWHNLGEEKRQRMWPYMIISAMSSNPGVLPSFIRATFDPSWCPSYVLEDVLYYLCRRCNADEMQQTSSLAAFLLEKCPPRYMVLAQNILLSISKSCSEPELVKMYERLKSTEHPLNMDTLQHFASKLAKSNDFKVEAAEIIHSLTENFKSFDMNHAVAASISTSLLGLSEDRPAPLGYAAPDELFKTLLECGLQPNYLNLSALMRNFAVRGHLDTAWEVLDIMLQRGMEPDTHVYSILLNAAKKNMDFASAQRIIHMIHANDAWTPLLATDCLDFAFRDIEANAKDESRRRQRKAKMKWKPILHLYAKFFDLAHLQKYTLFPLENAVASKGDSPKHLSPMMEMLLALPPRPLPLLMKPDHLTLCLMLSANLRGIEPLHIINRYYQRFLTLLEREDQTTLDILENQKTLLYDLFLRAFVQYRQKIQYSIDLVSTMVLYAEEEKQRLGCYKYHHPPSVYTWTILLNGFGSHKHTYGAVSALEIMTRHGVRPNTVTWNALILAFARVGNVGGVVKAVRCLEEAGYQTDDFTMRALNVLSRTQREKVIDILKKIRKEGTNTRQSDVRSFSGNVKAFDNASASLPNPRSWGISALPATTLARLSEVQKLWDRHLYRGY
ncbi:hypothetical protein F4780DRAFT_574850 [Xylariomycetidae sp. FL0641]|nr:hypothetical protein F4780DRAFT_574850 [Xylariomycetidae sp. FL0641]